MAPIRSARGFSLIEVLIASMLISTALAGVAQLVAVGVRQAAGSLREVSALAVAQSKLEQLRGLDWTYAADGSPVSSAELASSPTDSLTVDRTGYYDSLDAFGETVAMDDGARTAFRRRWAIALVAPADPHTLVLSVCVHAAGNAPSLNGGIADACISTIRTRKP